jgi:hypothetical protein
MSTVTGSGSPAAAAVAARRSATAGGQGPGAHQDDQDASQRGRGDGIVWASDYATADELRDLVENFKPGRCGDFDNPHWRGFVAGAEEVLYDAGAAGS